MVQLFSFSKLENSLFWVIIFIKFKHKREFEAVWWKKLIKRCMIFIEKKQENLRPTLRVDLWDIIFGLWTFKTFYFHTKLFEKGGIDTRSIDVLYVPVNPRLNLNVLRLGPFRSDNEGRERDAITALCMPTSGSQIHWISSYVSLLFYYCNKGFPILGLDAVNLTFKLSLK